MATLLAPLSLLAANTPAETLLPFLRGIELAPDRATLDGAIGGDAGSVLRDIAGNVESPSHARVHAYSALANYPGGATQTFLSATVTQYLPAEAGAQTLYLRAAVRSLGTVGGSAVVDELAAVLEHSNPDVRADGATALAATGSEAALPILRSRLLREQNDLVLLAISDAIRELTRT